MERNFSKQKFPKTVNLRWKNRSNWIDRRYSHGPSSSRIRWSLSTRSKLSRRNHSIKAKPSSAFPNRWLTSLINHSIQNKDLEKRPSVSISYNRISWWKNIEIVKLRSEIKNNYIRTARNVKPACCKNYLTMKYLLLSINQWNIYKISILDDFLLFLYAAYSGNFLTKK